MVLNNSCIKKTIGEIRKYFELSDDENTIFQNFMMQPKQSLEENT